MEVGGRDCAVCLQAIEGVGSFDLQCGHRFHLDCLWSWYVRAPRDLDTRPSCPLCRSPFYSQDVARALPAPCCLCREKLTSGAWGLPCCCAPFHATCFAAAVLFHEGGGENTPAGATNATFCPGCGDVLPPSTMERAYEYLQDFSDTFGEVLKLRELLRSASGDQLRNLIRRRLIPKMWLHFGQRCIFHWRDQLRGLCCGVSRLSDAPSFEDAWSSVKETVDFLLEMDGRVPGRPPRDDFLPVICSDVEAQEEEYLLLHIRDSTADVIAIITEYKAEFQAVTDEGVVIEEGRTLACYGLTPRSLVLRRLTAVPERRDAR